MKAVQYNSFGGTEVLQLADVPMPTPDTHELLIQVKAVSINPLDWKIRRGQLKFMSGSKFPKGVGSDFAGTVTTVGPDVTGFAVGDEVFGVVDAMKHGALGEYVVAPAKSVWHKPATISFEQAAALPVVGTAAYTALLEIGHITEGSDVLLNGASGGVGMFAIQIAKRAKANVTAVVSKQGVPFAQAWGADQVIDYTQQDVRQLGKTFDLVFDMAGKLPFDDAKDLMKDHAVFIDPSPTPLGIVTTAVTNLVMGKKDKMLMSNPNPNSIGYLLQALQEGLQIEVSRTFPMDEVVAAYQYAEKGGAIGKLVFTV